MSKKQREKNRCPFYRGKIIAQLEEMGLLVQMSEGRRNRRFLYKEYVDILSEGTELNR